MTACKHGHPWTLATTYARANGGAECRPCRRARQRARRQRPPEPLTARRRETLAVYLAIAGEHGCLLADLARACKVSRWTIADDLDALRAARRRDGAAVRAVLAVTP